LRVFEAIAAKESAKAQDAMRSLIQLARIDIPTSTAPVRRKVR
jgi:DNA-binding GntR family transcriptional regulator